MLAKNPAFFLDQSVILCQMNVFMTKYMYMYVHAHVYVAAKVGKSHDGNFSFEIILLRLTFSRMKWSVHVHVHVHTALEKVLKLTEKNHNFFITVKFFYHSTMK